MRTSTTFTLYGRRAAYDACAEANGDAKALPGLIGLVEGIDDAINEMEHEKRRLKQPDAGGSR